MMTIIMLHCRNLQPEIKIKEALHLKMNNDNEEFQPGNRKMDNGVWALSNSLTAISSNEHVEEFQLGISEKSKGKQQKYEVSQIPAEFDRMKNILEICNWLVKHSSILQLANQMYTASLTSIKNIGTFNESSSAISARIVNNRDGAHIWDKEIKCLFLRARFPPATCIDEFVKKIFRYLSCSKEGIE
ncbi:13695_t:CDS:2, partial [Cetraspora pellucida]